MARAVITVIEAEPGKVNYEVFNVGDTSENYTKGMLVKEIAKQIPNSKIKYVEKNEDPRDYRVNFDKIKNILNYKITKTVPEGIAQIKQVVENGFFTNPDDVKYKNID